MLAATENIAGHDKKRVTSVILKYIGQGGRMTAEVDDGFFQLFERRIFVRGEAYYDAGKVDPPVMIAENLWHTVVRGNDDYQVDIRLCHGKVIAAACTCQYSQRATYCKHVAAVLIFMRESRRRELDESQGQVSEFPHEALNCVRWYTMHEFLKYRGLTEGDWHAVKRIFEVLYCIPDLDTTCTHEVMDTVW